MGAIHGRATEYGTAHRAHQVADAELKEARARLLTLEGTASKAKMRLEEAKRLLLEEAQHS